MRWLVVAVLLGLAGCGSSPKTQFYALVPVPPVGQTSFAVRGHPLQVGDVNLPPELDRASLVSIGPGPAVSVSDVERWAAPLGGMIRSTLTADLRARLGEAHVIAPSDPAPPGGVRTVVVTIQQFAADSTGRVVLAADWAVAHGNPPQPTAVRHFQVVENAGSIKGSDVASAMSRALGVLADRIAGRAG